MIYSHEVQHMCVVKKGANHQCAPIPEEGKWVRATQITDISGLTHPRGSCRDNRLFRYDSLSGYGF